MHVELFLHLITFCYPQRKQAKELQDLEKEHEEDVQHLRDSHQEQLKRKREEPLPEEPAEIVPPMFATRSTLRPCSVLYHFLADVGRRQVLDLSSQTWFL